MYKGALYVNVLYTLFSKCTRALTLENVCQVAPNLSALIGEIVGARLISHAGVYVHVCMKTCITSLAHASSPTQVIIF